MKRDVVMKLDKDNAQSAMFFPILGEKKMVLKWIRVELCYPLSEDTTLQERLV